MKKVININFQGRVIPIEETAFELLKQYIESLRKYFAHEEGRDEIINDIESRIAELFSERIKKGSVCITDEDVNAVIASMGRPEDFEAEANGGATESTSGATGATGSTGFTGAQQSAGYTGAGGGAQQQSSYQQSKSSTGYNSGAARGRLYRNADDKIVGGVASGLANYLKIDPIVMRIVFVVLFGLLFWIYILLWVIIPSQSVQTNITKRLYRSAEDKVIAGVAGGLAAYFNIAPWIPRLIFAAPLIIALVSGPFDWWWGGHWNFWWGPKIISGSLSSTLFLTYIILWIAVPVAVTSAEKLEMRGEKVDLNSIRDTVKEDLEGFKGRAEKWGKEIKESAQQWGEKAKDFGQSAGSRAKTFTAEAGPMARSAGSGIGHAIGVLFKAFFMFIAAIIVVSLFGTLVTILFGGYTVFPAKEFLLSGLWQNALTWGTLVLFLGVPLVAMLTWLVRRIMGVRSRNHYLGYIFGSLWIIGLICAIILGGSLTREFMAGPEPIEEPINITQPASGKMYIDVAGNYPRHYRSSWFGTNRKDWPFYVANQDTIMLNTVRVNVSKSKDASFHVYRIRLSHGNTPETAKRLAERISFDVTQQDSTLVLPEGFAISRNEKFRNQQVIIVVEVPVGKRIQLDRKVDRYDWFQVSVNDHDNDRWDFEDDWDRSYHWQSNREYIMTPNDGLQRTEKYDVQDLKNGKFKFKSKDGDSEITIEGEINPKDSNKSEKATDTAKGYRYHRSEPAIDTSGPVIKKVALNIILENNTATGKKKINTAGLNGPITNLNRLL